MNNSFKKVWIELAYQQFCNYRLVNVVMTKGFETSSLAGPQLLIDSCGPRNDESLNPLEFHGKRRSNWPKRPQSGKPVA